MDISEEKLREFESTLKEIRDAALSDAQIFSDRSFRKGMAWMSFAFGILIAAFCVAGALLFGTGAGTSLSASLMLWAFVLLFVAGGILKFVLVSRVTARQNKSLRSSLQVIYGRGPLAATLASFISVAVAAVFFISTEWVNSSFRSRQSSSRSASSPSMCASGCLNSEFTAGPCWSRVSEHCFLSSALPGSAERLCGQFHL